MADINNSIKCSISNCKHFDDSHYCRLNTISIGGKCDCTNCKETECRSFELNN